MMQIYVDAVTASIKTNEAQYVLYHSLEYERTSNKNRVISLLNSGWKCSGEYIDGVGYEYFKVVSGKNIKALSRYLQLKLTDDVNIVFKETYDCFAKPLGYEATVSCDGIEERTVAYIGEKAKVLREFLLFTLGIRQDSETLIAKLETETL